MIPKLYFTDRISLRRHVIIYRIWTVVIWWYQHLFLPWTASSSTFHQQRTSPWRSVNYYLPFEQSVDIYLTWGAVRPFHSVAEAWTSPRVSAWSAPGRGAPWLRRRSARPRSRCECQTGGRRWWTRCGAARQTKRRSWYSWWRVWASLSALCQSCPRSVCVVAIPSGGRPPQSAQSCKTHRGWSLQEQPYLAHRWASPFDW